MLGVNAGTKLMREGARRLYQPERHDSGHRPHLSRKRMRHAQERCQQHRQERFSRSAHQRFVAAIIRSVIFTAGFIVIGFLLFRPDVFPALRQRTDVQFAVVIGCVLLLFFFIGLVLNLITVIRSLWSGDGNLPDEDDYDHHPRARRRRGDDRSAW